MMKIPSLIRITTPLLLMVFLAACHDQSSKPDGYACPQTRNTEYAPAKIASLNNPFTNHEQSIELGETLFNNIPTSVACSECHGRRGDANGPMATMFEPAPRDFTCSKTMSKIPDGQLYWIIKNGSIGTSMPAFTKLNDEEIWQLVSYIRTLEDKAMPYIFIYPYR